jgi:4-diphosphocytidyl-2-C-methyl-D-erythritol kinase
MICFPNCKINLGLSVTQKRQDGYHNIESVFYPVKLCDSLEIIISERKTNIQTSGIKIPGNSNLCITAYNLLKNDFDLPPVQIYLHKQIPVGAGLGGGSSDATFTIKLLNKLFLLNLSKEQMKDYANKLGSDCAFFIYNKPAFVYSKGDIFNPVEIDITKYYILVVKPNIHINTSEAYSEITMSKKQQQSINKIIKRPVHRWKTELYNDFEYNIFKKYPELKMIKEKLYEYGALYASMSGTGSAIYGIFEEKNNEKIFKDNYFVWQGKMQKINEF